MSFETFITDTVRRAVREELHSVFEQYRRQLPATVEPTQQQLLTVPEVAKRCGDAHPATVRGWISSGRLRASRATRHYLVKLDDLEEFLAGGTPAAPVPDAEEVAARILGRIGRRK